MYWNVQTHHFLYCRLYQQMLQRGRLWSSNLLVFERTHIALRAMARSSKCMFTSILLNYVNHLAAQTQFRFSDTHFSNKPKASSLCARVGVVAAAGNCVPSATRSAPSVKISTNLFSHVVDLWILNTPFEGVRDTYVRQMELRGLSRQYALNHMSEYDPPSWVPGWARPQFNINNEAKVLTYYKL